MAAETGMVQAPLDYRKIGRVHDSDTPIQNVISAEMTRIHRAFDTRLVKHTEVLENRVNAGQSLSGMESTPQQNPSAQAKRR